MNKESISIELAKGLARQSDEVLNMKDIKQMFGVKTNEAIYAKIDAGLPARRKPGIGYYFLKSEIITYLKG